MSQIWRAAGIPGDRIHTSPSDRYIKRHAAAPPLRALETNQFPGRRSFGRRSIALTALIIIVLFGGGVAAGRYALPSQSGPASPQVRAAAFFSQALSHQKAGQLAAAEKGFLQTVKIDPLNYVAYYDLGVIYQNSNRMNDAILAYEKTLIINSKFQPALFNLAILESTTAPAVAVSLYKRLQQLGAQSPAAVSFNLGLVYRQLGKVAEGNAQLRYAISLDSSLASKVPAQYQPISASSTSPRS